MAQVKKTSDRTTIGAHLGGETGGTWRHEFDDGVKQQIEQFGPDAAVTFASIGQSMTLDQIYRRINI